MSIECKQSFTLGDVSSILQAHRGLWIVSLLQVNLINKTLNKPLSEPMSTHISKTMNQTEAQTKLLETSLGKLICSQYLMKTLVRQSRTKCSKKNYWMVTEVMENYRNREVGQSPLVLSKVPAVIEKHQDYCGRKF